MNEERRKILEENNLCEKRLHILISNAQNNLEGQSQHDFLFNLLKQELKEQAKQIFKEVNEFLNKEGDVASWGDYEDYCKIEEKWCEK